MRTGLEGCCAISHAQGIFPSKTRFFFTRLDTLPSVLSSFSFWFQLRLDLNNSPESNVSNIFHPLFMSYELKRTCFVHHSLCSRLSRILSENVMSEEDVTKDNSILYQMISFPIFMHSMRIYECHLSPEREFQLAQQLSDMESSLGNWRI